MRETAFLCFIAQLLNFLLLLLRSSYYASTLFPAVNPQPRAVKRQRLMASPQQRSAGILANSQNQVVIQSPQAQQQIAANKLTTAANNLLQLQQQQQILLASASPVVNLCNSISSQNFINSNSNSFKMCNGDNTESVNQQNSAAGPFKVYSEFFWAANRVLDSALLITQLNAFRLPTLSFRLGLDL